MSNKKISYRVQPKDKNPMLFESDQQEIIEDAGVAFYKDGVLVFFAPFANTTYITQEGASEQFKSQR